MIRVDAWWLAVQPLDMRVGTEAALARVVQVFGQAHPHHAYLFANRRANRMKVLVHDGIGVWLAARRLNIGKFTWSSDASNCARDSGSVLAASLDQVNLPMFRRRAASHTPMPSCTSTFMRLARRLAKR